MSEHSNLCLIIQTDRPYPLTDEELHRLAGAVGGLAEVVAHALHHLAQAQPVPAAPVAPRGASVSSDEAVETTLTSILSVTTSRGQPNSS